MRHTCRPRLAFARTRTIAVLIVAASVLAPTPGRAQSAGTRRFAEVAVSPDGRRVAWIGPDGRVALADPSGGGTASVSLSGGDSAVAISWASDSRQLAVLGGAGTPTLYIALAAGGAARRVAAIPGSVHEPRFSPDGARIAMLYSSPDEQANSPVAATPRDTGVMDTHVDRQHLALVDVSTGGQRVLTPPDLYVYEFDWAPDSRQLVVSAARGSGNNNWWVARLLAVDAGSGAAREIAAPRVQIADPRWSPDGAQIAFVGGLMSDQGVTGGDLYVVPAAGGAAPRNLTPNARVSFASAAWRGPRTLLGAAWAQGGTQLATVDVRGGPVTPLWSADEWVTTGTNVSVPGVSSSRDGAVVAMIRESPVAPPEVWAGPPGRWVQLTRVNETVRPAWGKVESVRWRSDSFDVQGFLIFPRDFDPRRRYPMVVQVHGGPSSAARPAFARDDAYEVVLSQAGYFVFQPNPRGSYGQGEAFTRANVKDFGSGDLRDIMAGVDTVLRRFPVDSARLGVFGWSYGGFMTMWTVTQTARFKAAVAGAGIANWLSYTGQNGISEWMVPFFGATAYEDPAVYAKSSPINYINRARTPTLVVVGERDAECPAPQSFEFWRGLQHAGVTTQLVVYPDEGHHFENPEHVRDLRARTVRWFDSYLKAQQP